MASVPADKPSICGVQAVTWSSGWACIDQMRHAPSISAVSRGSKPMDVAGPSMPVTAFNGNGLVSKLEILRGDLVDVLYQATKDQAPSTASTPASTELNQNEDAVEATLSDGTTLSADLVVGADGPHSAVRRLVFGPEEQFVKPLGGYNAWFTAPDTVGLDGWYLMYQAPGLNASMRPSHDPALAKAGLAFRSEPVAYDRRNADEQRALLARHFAGAGWQCDALLSAAAADATTSTSTRSLQVHMPTISQGRVTLAGDAGYCASPLSGMGTSLALVGAYVLAGELGPADSLDANRIQAALQRYESVMRPYIDRCQDLPNGIDGYLPKSCQRHRRHRAGDEVDAALAVSFLRREEVVHHRRRHRAAGLLTAFCQLFAVLRCAELGLGDAVDAVQRGLVDTDVFADDFGRDARVAQPQCQRVRQRKLAKCALMRR